MKAEYLVGIDEVGRGPVAGPLLVAAVLAPKEKSSAVGRSLTGIKDSKKLSERQREAWFGKLQELRAAGLLDWRISFVMPSTIDQKGIAYALKLTVMRTLKYLGCDPTCTRVLLDGSLYAPRRFVNQQTIIRGEEKEKLIAAASIVAKVSRDRRMRNYAKRFPQYGFQQHKGYGTKAHLSAIKKHGMCPLHRRSFLGRT